MRISFQTAPDKRIDLEFGYNTALFSGTHWFSIISVDLNPAYGEVVYASIVFELFKHYKYWKLWLQE